MIIKLVKAHKINGVKFKKGATVIVPRAVALKLCEDEIAVTTEDVPCHERNNAPYKKKAKKKSPSTADEDLDVDIPTEL